jgi:hypothetical protein
LRSELSRWSTLLTLTTSITSAVITTVSTVTVTATTSTTTTEWLALALALTHHSTWRSVGSLLLDVGCWDDLSWEMEPLAEVIETLWGEGVVVVLPGELSLDVSAGGKGLKSLDHVEVLGVNLWVLWEIILLWGNLLSQKLSVLGLQFQTFPAVSNSWQLTATPSRKRYS